jgi:hypothetical protein
MQPEASRRTLIDARPTQSAPLGCFLRHSTLASSHCILKTSRILRNLRQALPYLINSSSLIDSKRSRTFELSGDSKLIDMGFLRFRFRREERREKLHRTFYVIAVSNGYRKRADFLGVESKAALPGRNDLPRKVRCRIESVNLTFRTGTVSGR